MHRLTNCNYNLYKWKLKEQPYCSYCKHNDTMEHHFYLCGFCKLFWEQVGNHIAVTFGLTESLNLTICEVMFGLEYAHNPTPVNRVINMIIVIGKWYINNCRNIGKQICFLEFINVARKKIQIYEIIYRKSVVGVNKKLSEVIQNINL